MRFVPFHYRTLVGDAGKKVTVTFTRRVLREGDCHFCCADVIVSDSEAISRLLDKSH
jgi:hypothetical protein